MMSSDKIYLVMQKRYDEGYSKPIVAFDDKLKALAMCMRMTQSKDIFSYSLLEVPFLDNIVEEG